MCIELLKLFRPLSKVIRSGVVHSHDVLENPGCFPMPIATTDMTMQKQNVASSTKVTVYMICQQRTALVVLVTSLLCG